MRSFSLLAIVLLLAACTPSPVTPPPDGSDGAPPRPPAADSAPPTIVVNPACAAACAAMAAAGCSEGKAATCPTTMTKIDADRLISGGNHLPITCAACAGAKTAADVAALCGSSCSP